MIQFKDGHHKVPLLGSRVCGLQRTCHANGCCAEAKQSQSRCVNAPGSPANQALGCTEIREGFPLPSLYWSKCDQNPPITTRGSAGLPWAPGLVPRVPGLCCAAGQKKEAGGPSRRSTAGLPGVSCGFAGFGGFWRHNSATEKFRKNPAGPAARAQAPARPRFAANVYMERTEAGSSSRVTAKPCVTVACNRRAPCNRRV